MKTERGFTLIELLVVVVIIGILASLALPRFVKTLEKARKAEALQHLGATRAAEERYISEHTTVTTLFADLDYDDPNAATPRYFNYTIEPNDPGHCVTDGTSDYYVTALRTAAGGRPAPQDPPGVYHVTLSGDGNLCDDMD